MTPRTRVASKIPDAGLNFVFLTSYNFFMKSTRKKREHALGMMPDENAADCADETGDYRENLTVPTVQKSHVCNFKA